MNEQVKQEWVGALKSGHYPQTKCYLRDDKGFCCLGVLTDLYLKHHNLGWGELQVNGRGDTYMLPNLSVERKSSLAEEVTEWAGIPTLTETPFHGVGATNGLVWVHGMSTSLATLNDNSVGFDKIADIIERYL